jgi:aerobic C4-dicarboxylate transport protein
LLSFGVVQLSGLSLVIFFYLLFYVARALTKLLGIGVATVVVAKWTGDLDVARMHQVLNNETAQDADDPEEILDKVEAHMPPALPPGV